MNGDDWLEQRRRTDRAVMNGLGWVVIITGTVLWALFCLATA